MCVQLSAVANVQPFWVKACSIVDDVMNAQREVIYKRRYNALNGERLTQITIWMKIMME